MQKIIPHIWYNTEAREATAFYTTLFPDSRVDHITTLHSTPSGDADSITFTLAGQTFMAINGGPFFKLNPSISLFTVFDDETEIDRVWKALAEGGKVLMEYQTYPWAKKYGWLKDKYGLSWQLSMSENHKLEQKITPLLMFTRDGSGNTKEALEMYTSIFPDSKIGMMVPFEEGEGGVVGHIKHARFTLCGYDLMAMDGGTMHEFGFNEGLSLMVMCDTQEEMDRYSNALSAVPEAEQCGWLKDKFGVSWQIVPTVMMEMMTSDDQEKIDRVTKAFMPMKRLNIAELEKAADGN